MSGGATRFFLLTFALSWVLWLPLAMVRLGLLHLGVSSDALTALALPGVLMPGVAAMILAARQPGGMGIRALLGRMLIWRVGSWWAPAVLLQPAMLLMTAGLCNALKWGEAVNLALPTSFAAPLVMLGFIVVAATGEEIGWRGYALPALQAVRTPLSSSIILGFAVATWHLPYWILQGILGMYGLGYFVLNYVFVVALTLQLTWVFNRTRASLLLPVAFHVSFNVLNVALLPVTSSVPAFAVLTVLECGVALMMLRSLGSPVARPSAA